MIVYLTTKQINSTPTEKETVFTFAVLPSFGAKKVETKTEPEWYKTFKTEQEALNYLNR
jgi:hypothetical protein